MKKIFSLLLFTVALFSFSFAVFAETTIKTDTEKSINNIQTLASPVVAIDASQSDLTGVNFDYSKTLGSVSITNETIYQNSNRRPEPAIDHIGTQTKIYLLSPSEKFKNLEFQPNLRLSKNTSELFLNRRFLARV